MSPAIAANPMASLVETTQTDVPDAAACVLGEDGSLAFLPDGDPRALLHVLADTAPLEDLATGWHTAVQVRQWALDLCHRVETELEAGQFGAAVEEWVRGRQLLSGVSVLAALRRAPLDAVAVCVLGTDAAVPVPDARDVRQRAPWLPEEPP
ncbi:hypothetical protein [Streptomyces sp. NPDC101234]|uniref:hypothetical protein n=1 Tax=Streptomyces sp. NPDC101234 TaxID=3366138 RepID=UPI0038039C95